MTGSHHHFERVYDLPPEIVFDALVDSDLVSGWLAEADIDPVEGGRYDLNWRHFDTALTTLGRIEQLVVAEQLTVETSNFGASSFTLEPLDEGPRGRSTLLRVDVDSYAEQEFSAPIAATWVLSLEQLASLLHGHPVDWSTWQRDHGDEWNQLVLASHNDYK